MIIKRVHTYFDNVVARAVQADTQGRPSRKLTSSRRRNKRLHARSKFQKVVERHSRNGLGGDFTSVFTFNQIKENLLPGDSTIEFVKWQQFVFPIPGRRARKTTLRVHTYVAPSGNVYEVYTDTYKDILAMKANGDWIPVKRYKEWWQEDQ